MELFGSLPRKSPPAKDLPFSPSLHFRFQPLELRLGEAGAFLPRLVD